MRVRCSCTDASITRFSASYVYLKYLICRFCLFPILGHKKQSRIVDEFPEFDEVNEGDDLFSTSKKGTAESVMPSFTTTDAEQKAKDHFNELQQFMTARTGRKPATKHPLLRNSALSRLITAAQSREDMELVKAMLERWRDSGRSISSATAGEFLGE